MRITIIRCMHVGRAAACTSSISLIEIYKASSPIYSELDFSKSVVSLVQLASLKVALLLLPSLPNKTMLTMADSPTTVTSTAAQQGSVCASPQEPSVVAVGVKNESAAPKSPKMKRSCNKSNRQRGAPYPDRSPGGSSCTSSDESNGEYENGENTVQKKIKRIAANKRERKRMHTVNSAFDQLRELVPTYPSNRKLSKIDTLRLACTYIQDLVSLLHNSHAIQGEDVQLQLFQGPINDGYMQINGGYHVKAEMSEFSAFSPYRLPQPCITSVSL